MQAPARGRAAGLGRRSLRGDARGSARYHARRPAWCPRAAGGAAPPAPVSHRGLRRAGCRSLRTGSGAASPARARLRLWAPLPAPSGRREHGSPAQSCRCTATASCARAAASPSPMLLFLVRGRSWVPKFGDELWRERCLVGLEQRLVQKCAAAAPRDSVQSRRALRLLCNLGCVLVEATYGFGSGISHKDCQEAR